jgi:hypothetical protein
MKRLLSEVAMILGLAGFGLNLSAQQDPAPSSQTQQQTNATSQQSARSFEGQIEKSGGKLVLQELWTNTAYQLDDQNKAKQYQGMNVKVMATLDPTTNMLHVVDITPSESR